MPTICWTIDGVKFDGNEILISSVAMMVFRFVCGLLLSKKGLSFFASKGRHPYYKYIVLRQTVRYSRVVAYIIASSGRVQLPRICVS